LFKGGKPTLTIKDVETEELEGDKGKQVKGIVTFNERPMQLVLNKTNGLCLKSMFGKELKNWIGKKVTLFASQWNGEECIRVWGSPDIEKDEEITIELPRKKPLKMTMHAVKAGAKKDSQSADPRILAAWDILGWKVSEGEADMSSKSAEMTGARYLDHLNSLIDESNAVELSGQAVP
jgi:hypothetical protein